MAPEPTNFEIDELQANNPDAHTLGINLACAWPLPSPVVEVYEEFSAEVKKLDPALYVYPLSQTHITVAVIKDFHELVNPDVEQQKIFDLLMSDVVSNLTSLLDDYRGGPIKLRLNGAKLSSKAGFLSFAEDGGNMTYLRLRAEQLLKKIPQLQPRIPNIIHSTFIRYIGIPKDPAGLCEKFEQLAGQLPPVEFVVPELLLTFEPRPYMRMGKVLQIYNLMIS